MIDRDGCGQQWDTTAFVLGELGGQQRAALVTHLQHCASCHAEVSSLTELVDRLTQLAPPRAPSPGFVDRVIRSLPLERTTRPSLPRTTRPRRRRSAQVGAAFALAAGAVTVGLTLSGPGTARQPDTAGALRPHPPVTAEMRTTAGDEVGQTVVFDQHPALVTVALDVPAGTPWSPGGPYQVLAVRRTGQTVSLGAVSVVGGKGGFQARTTVPAGDIATVRVEGPDGQDLCAGLLPPGPAPPGR